MKILKQIILTTTILVTIFSQSITVMALEEPIAPIPPVEPSLSVLDTPSVPSQPVAPTSPSIPTLNDILSPTPTPTKAENVNDNHNTDENKQSESDKKGVTADGKTGDRVINTGDSTLSAEVSTLSNNNMAASASSNQVNSNGSTGVINNNNSSSSINNNSSENQNNTKTNQDNIADVKSNLTLGNITGQNSASKNVGKSFIQTGDTNTSGTIITSVNSNVDAVAVSEFNVVDDQKGDIVLDFAKNCISGCGSTTTAQNSNNGASSQNTGNIADITNNNTFQNNDATVGSTLTLNSDSGNNLANQNTNGDSVIKTGDANVFGSALTLANNNIAGQILYGVVNIFGNLVGDIILPDSALSALVGCANGCGGTTSATNSGNGNSSENSASIGQTTNNNTLQTNAVDIQNNLNLNATSGNNVTSQNTGGDSAIKTGVADVISKTLNVVNSNLDNGPMWLVIVNQTGQWVGKILGAPDGTNFAGSSGTDFQVAADGTITATNSGNGANSQNTTDVNKTNNNNLIQNNNANITNNLNLSANSGKNSASQNTGGDNFIQTGDAKIIANLINFVNNNISSSGNLAVVTINVFGSWLGDFITPGTKKESKPIIESQQNSEDQNFNAAGNNNGDESISTTNLPLETTSNLEPNVKPEEPLNQNNQLNGTSAIVNEISKNQAQVAGFKTEVKNLLGTTNIESSKNTKPIKLNLAWALLILPLVTITGLLKLLRRKS